MSEQFEDKYVIRFPRGMRDKIKVEAAKNRRSMNAEIVVHLERIFDNLELETTR